MGRSTAVLVAVFTLLVLSAPAAAQAPVTLRIVFPEGFSARQMADRVAEVRKIAIRKRGVTPRLTGGLYKQATGRARAPQPFRRHLRRRSVEGFLFPSLYEFTKETRASELVADQLHAFGERWSTIDLRRARAKGRTPYDVLIVASIIEREAAAPEERRLVSAVVYNRLAKNMTLSIDATLRYGLGIPGTRPITSAQLRSRSRYNTHRWKGLPPTPISNPGVPSMRAAASPAPRNYLFYVRKPGSLRHFFTADEAEFCRKLEEYGYPPC